MKINIRDVMERMENDESIEQNFEASEPIVETEIEEEIVEEEPAESVEPEEPAESEGSEEPAESVEPEEPAESAEPEAPAESVEPEAPAESTETETVELVVMVERVSFAEIIKKYGSLIAIIFAFIGITVFLVVYTTMTPRQIELTLDGSPTKVVTKEYIVRDMLEKEKISYCEDDYLSVSPGAFISDGMNIVLEHATEFTVIADGETKKYKSLETTVLGALQDIGIEVDNDDILSHKLDATIVDGMEITLKRVEVKELIRGEKVNFKTIEKLDSNMDEDETKVLKNGQYGRDHVTYRVKYIDGEEVSKKELSRKVVKKPVNKVVAKGTRVKFNGKSYSRKLVVKAYSYTGGGRTAMGTRARVGEIAVDPRVIPLGTNVYIEGVGPRRAEDTGGNIKGNTIDIYMNTRAECTRWGVRYVTIYIE